MSSQEAPSHDWLSTLLVVVPRLPSRLFVARLRPNPDHASATATTWFFAAAHFEARKGWYSFPTQSPTECLANLARCLRLDKLDSVIVIFVIVTV